VTCTFNGTPVHGTFQGATLSGTLSPVNSAGDIVFVAVHIEKHNTPSITGTVSGGGVTWNVISRQTQNNGTTFNTTELWYAYAASALTGAITLTLSAAADATAWGAFAVSGAYAPAPLDPNGSLPATFTSTSGSVFVTYTYSTTNANDLILSVVGASNNVSPGTPTGFTNLFDTINSSGAWRYAHIRVDYRSVSSPQSSVTTTYTSGSEVPGAILHAATSDAPSSTILSIAGRITATSRAPQSLTLLGLLAGRIKATSALNTAYVAPQNLAGTIGAQSSLNMGYSIRLSGRIGTMSQAQPRVLAQFLTLSGGRITASSTARMLPLPTPLSIAGRVTTQSKMALRDPYHVDGLSISGRIGATSSAQLWFGGRFSQFVTLNLG